MTTVIFHTGRTAVRLALRFLAVCSYLPAGSLRLAGCNIAAVAYIIAPSRGVDTGFEGVLWGDIPVRKYNKIKGRSRKRPQPAHKAPQCGAFRGFETAV